MDTMELVDLWEKPMPAASRALLLAEIDRRGYRKQSLPPPPPDDATAVALPTQEEVDRHRMVGSALLLLVLGFMQLASGTYALWALRESGLLLRLVGAGFPFAIGVAFLVLYRSARTRPHPALTIGLVLYLGLQALQAVVLVVLGDPTPLSGGVPVAILVVLGLGYGAAASRRRSSRERSAEPEPMDRPES
jgi:peptidoglycan/LPS O-acetylase OafA/YrhL